MKDNHALNDRAIKPRPSGIDSNDGIAGKFKRIAGKQLDMNAITCTIKTPVVLELEEVEGRKNSFTSVPTIWIKYATTPTIKIPIPLTRAMRRTS